MNRNKIKKLIAITVTTSTLFQLNGIKATTAFAKDNSSSTKSYSLEEEKEQYEAFQKLYNEIKTTLQEKVNTMGDNLSVNEDTRSHDIFKYLVEDIEVIRDDNFYFTKEGEIEIGVSSSNDRKGKIKGKVLIRAPYSKDEFIPFEIEYKYTPVETELLPPYEGKLEDDLSASNDEQSDYEAFQKLYSEIKNTLQEKINTMGDNFTANENTRSHDIFTYLVEDIDVVRKDNFYFTKEGDIQIGVSSSNDRKGKITGKVLINAPYSKDEFISFEIEYKYVPEVTDVQPPYQGTVEDDLLNANDDKKDESSDNGGSSTSDNTQETEDDKPKDEQIGTESSEPSEGVQETEDEKDTSNSADAEVDNNTPNSGQVDFESNDSSEDEQETEDDKNDSSNVDDEDLADNGNEQESEVINPSEDEKEIEDDKDTSNSEDSDNQNSDVNDDQAVGDSGSSGGSGGSSGGSSSSENSNESSNGSSSESNGKPSLVVNSDGSLQIKDSNGQAATGWQNINNKWYLCDSDGNTLTGWQKVNGQWYYLNNDSTMHTGWLKDSKGKWYHLKSNGSMSTGWLKDTDGKWYHLKSNGSMSTGWLKDTNGKWYHLQSNGSMSTGWLKDTNGKWYYLNSNGAMMTGWLKDTNGKWYYLNADGSMASNIKVNGYYLGKDGALI